MCHCWTRQKCQTKGKEQGWAKGCPSRRHDGSNKGTLQFWIYIGTVLGATISPQLPWSMQHISPVPWDSTSSIQQHQRHRGTLQRMKSPLLSISWGRARAADGGWIEHISTPDAKLCLALGARCRVKGAGGLRRDFTPQWIRKAPLSSSPESRAVNSRGWSRAPRTGHSLNYFSCFQKDQHAVNFPLCK